MQGIKFSLKGIENPILVKISSNEQIVKESSGTENLLVEPLWLKSNKFGRAHIAKFTADDHNLYRSIVQILVERINDVPVYYAGSTRLNQVPQISSNPDFEILIQFCT